MRPRVVAVPLCMLGLLAHSPAASADVLSGGGYVDQAGTPIAEVGLSGSGGSGGSTSGGGAIRCVLERVELAPGEEMFEPDGRRRVPSGPGAWHRRRCMNVDGQEFANEMVFVADVDPRQLAEQALRKLQLSTPEIYTSPPPERDQLVNLPTWLWVGDAWQPQSATASLPGVSVTVTALPSSVTWDMGTGDRVVCRGPGRAYDPRRREEEQSTDCSYTYRRSSAGQPSQRFPVRATMTWRVSWTASGIAGGGDLGEVSRSTSFGLRVAEGQALVTRGR